MGHRRATPIGMPRRYDPDFGFGDEPATELVDPPTRPPPELELDDDDLEPWDEPLPWVGEPRSVPPLRAIADLRRPEAQARSPGRRLTRGRRCRARPIGAAGAVAVASLCGGVLLGLVCFALALLAQAS